MSLRRPGATRSPDTAMGEDVQTCRFLPSLFAPDEEQLTLPLLHRRQVATLLGGIIAVALAARLLMAALIQAPCNDSYFYFCIADFLSKQKFEQAFLHLNLNTYPAILAVLHSWGIDWITAGKFWGVFASTLTILPLFGWVRRLWGDRIGLAAALLYAIHPELIEIGVEPIREPTFWLFLAISLYAMTRGFQEQSFRYFCLAGVATFLAMFTRTEGLVLLIVLAIGAVISLIEHHSLKQRLRISLGALSCLLMTPILLVAVNVYLLPDHTRWEFGRLSHLEYLANVAFPSDVEPADDPTPAQPVIATSEVSESASDVVPDEIVEQREPDPVPQSEPEPLPDPVPEPVPEPRPVLEIAESNEPVVEPSVVVSTAAVPPEKTLPARAAKFLTELNDVYGPHNLLLFALGVSLFWRRRMLWRLVPLFLPMLAVMVAVWLRLAADSGGINGRYFLTMYFFVVPVLGVGLLAALQMVANHKWKWSQGRPGGLRAATIAAGMLAIVLVADAVTSRHRSREADLKIARSIVERYGPIDHVISDHQTTRIGFGIHRNLPEILAFSPLVETADQPGNNVVLVSTKSNDPLFLLDLKQSMTRLGYEANDADYWLERRRDLIVYTRKRELAAMPPATHQ